MREKARQCIDHQRGSKGLHKCEVREKRRMKDVPTGCMREVQYYLCPMRCRRISNDH